MPYRALVAKGENSGPSPPVFPIPPTANSATPPLPCPDLTLITSFPTDEVMFRCPALPCEQWYFTTKSLTHHCTTVHKKSLSISWTCPLKPCHSTAITMEGAHQHLETVHGVILPPISPLPRGIPNAVFQCWTIGLPLGASHYACPIVDECSVILKDIDNLRRHLIAAHVIYMRTVWRCPTYSCSSSLDKSAVKNTIIQHAYSLERARLFPPLVYLLPVTTAIWPYKSNPPTATTSISVNFELPSSLVPILTIKTQIQSCMSVVLSKK